MVVGWNGHSAAHNRNKNLMSFGRYTAALVGGFSLEWWSPKHNMHHMFTNLTKFDEDIQHSYKVYLYPFLYLKWRFDSLVCAVTTKNYVRDIIYLVGRHLHLNKLYRIAILSRVFAIFLDRTAHGWILLRICPHRQSRKRSQI